MSRGEFNDISRKIGGRTSPVTKNPRKGSKRRTGRLVIATGVGIFGITQSLRAGTNTWTGLSTTDNFWNDTANWTGTIATGNNLQFGGTVQLSNDNNFTAASIFPTIVFNSNAGAFVFSGNSLELNAGSASSMINNSTATQTIDLPVILAGGRTIDAAAGNIVIEDGLSGTSGGIFGVNPSLTTPGPTSNAVVVLESAATYTVSGSTNSTSIDSSTLQIGSTGSLPSVTTANANNGFVVLGASTGTSGVLELGDSTSGVDQTINSLATVTGAGTACAVMGGSSVSTSTLTIDYLGTSESYGGALGGSGSIQNNLAFVKAGPGLLHLSSTCVGTYTGGTTIQNGTLQVAATAALPTGTSMTMGDSNNDSGTLDLDGTTPTISSISTVGTGTQIIGNSSPTHPAKLTYAGTTGVLDTFNGNILNFLTGGSAAEGTGLTVSTGTLALSGTNTYANGTTLNGGVLNFTSSALGTGAITLDGGTLQYATGNTTDISTQTINIGINGGTVDTNSNNVAFGSAIGTGATGPFTKTGAGTLTLNAANTFTTNTNVTGGTLLIGSTGSIASGNVGISLGAALTVNGSISASTALTDNGTLNSNVPALTISTLNGSGTANLNSSMLLVNGGGIFSGSIAGSGGGLVVGGGSLVLSGSSSYGSGTTLNAGVLNFSSIGNLGSGPITFNGGTLQYGSAYIGSTDISAVAVTLAAGGGSIDTNGNNVTLANSIGNAGAGSLTKIGSGTLTLSGANNYTGGTNVNAGTLVIAPTSTANVVALPANSAVSVGAAGTLQLADNASASTPFVSSSTDISNQLMTISSLSIASGGVLDIRNNHFYVADSGGPDDATYQSILGYVANGANSISNGVITSTEGLPGYGVGVVDGNDGVLGTPVSAGQIEVAYTLEGDANLDGKVDITDFNIFAPNFGLPTTLGWEAGDFNYSGAVDIGDFNLFAGNFGLSDNGTAVSMPAADYAALDAFAAANGLSLTSVPEPASLSLLALGSVGILARRRRNR